MGGIVQVAVSALSWGANGMRLKLDQRKIYKWLKSNTRDYPGKSHVDLRTICKGVRLLEERAREACMLDSAHLCLWERAGTVERMAGGATEHL